MKILENLYYTKEHEWVRVEGEKAFIGITDFAQHALGSIVFVELPDQASEFSAGDTFGVVESVKAASDVYMPITGKVVEANEELVDAPELVNEKPYESWMVCVELAEASELQGLLSSEEYKEFCDKEA